MDNPGHKAYTGIKNNASTLVFKLRRKTWQA